MVKITSEQFNSGMNWLDVVLATNKISRSGAWKLDTLASPYVDEREAQGDDWSMSHKSKGEKVCRSR